MPYSFWANIPDIDLAQDATDVLRYSRIVLAKMPESIWANMPYSFWANIPELFSRLSKY